MQNKKTKQRGGWLVLLRALIIAAAGLLIGVSVYFINTTSFVGGGYPMPFGYGASVVLSGSMEPALRVDDLIFVHREPDYDVGDVVVYRRMGVSVVHRIVSESDLSVITKGDANNAADDPISPSDIKGEVVGRVAGAGVWVDFLRSPVGVIVVLGAAALLLELSFRKEKAQDDRQLDDIRREIEMLKNEMNLSSTENNE